MRLDLASFMVRLECRSSAERLMIPAFVFFFRLLYPFRRCNNPKDPLASSSRALLLAYHGRHTEAQRYIAPAAADRLMSRTWHHAAYQRACISALGGDASQSVKWLEETVTAGMPIYPAFARDRCFDPIRRDARFEQFMTKLKPVWDDYERRMR